MELKLGNHGMMYESCYIHLLLVIQEIFDLQMLIEKVILTLDFDTVMVYGNPKQDKINSNDVQIFHMINSKFELIAYTIKLCLRYGH